MPELPEVETVKNGLKPIIGSKLKSFIVHKDGWRKPVPVDKLVAHIGKPIIDTYRRAKWPALVFEDGCLWMHLGMSGQIRLFNSDKNLPPLEKHDHIELFFEDGKVIRFKDERRFGVVAWTDYPYSEPPSSEKLGPEPFDPDWDDECFYKQLSKYKTPIKPFIMNAKIVVGVGNIYASEALFLAKISPLKPANTLTANDASNLRQKIIHVLKEGIKGGGSTLKDHRMANGDIGDYQNSHTVYGKEGKPCIVCGTPIVKITQATRSTFYCPTCQPE